MSDASRRVAEFLAAGGTGQIILNCDRGVICSVELKERLRTDGKWDTAKLLLDLDSTGQANTRQGW